jgi:uncharacterized repeat protein (TIGR01451 family)
VGRKNIAMLSKMLFMKDFLIENEYICGNIRAKNKYCILLRAVIILLILSGFISFVSAYEESDLQWAPGVSNTLHLNDVITYNEYTVKAIGFPEPVESNRYSETPSEPVNPYVGLNVSKNGSFANNTALGIGESYITADGELRVMVTGLPSGNSTEWLYESYNPWTVVELDPRGKPELDLSIDTDKGEYSSAEDTEIIAYVTISNSGMADAVNVDLNIDAPFSVKNGSLKYHYERIKKGESVTEDITFILPVTTEDSTYNILANVSAYDVKNLAYPANSSKQISMVVNPKWSMSLQKTTLEKIYLKDSAMISLDLKNDGKVDIKNVSIDDALPTGFKLVGNTSLHWVADIPAGGEWNYHYLVAPLEPNSEGVVFPVATAEFKVNRELYGIRSNQPKIVVYGPLVTLNKSTDVSAINPGDTVTVIVTAKNTGSTPTKVFIRDQLPAKTTLISGVTAYEDFLEAGKEVNFSYTLKVDSDIPIELPLATAQYYEFGTKGVMINTSSQKLELMIKSSTEANVNVTPANVQPSTEPESNYTNPSAVNGSDEGTHDSGTNVSRTNVSGTNVSGTKGSGIFDFISKIIRAIMKIQ